MVEEAVSGEQNEHIHTHDASRCAARRRGDLGPFLRFSFWRTLYVAAFWQVDNVCYERKIAAACSAAASLDIAAVPATTGLFLASAPVVAVSLHCTCCRDLRGSLPHTRRRVFRLLSTFHPLRGLWARHD